MALKRSEGLAGLSRFRWYCDIQSGDPSTGLPTKTEQGRMLRLYLAGTQRHPFPSGGVELGRLFGGDRSEPHRLKYMCPLSIL